VLGLPSLRPVLAWQVLYAIMSAAGVGFGIAILATARRDRRTRIWDRAWWAGSTPAALSLGLALVLGLGASYAAAYWAPSTLHSGAFMLLWMSPMLVVCLGFLLAFLLANRDAKQAIKAGKATRYWLSPDKRWWWDGVTWVSVSAGAPADAIRAPGGNYWWAGNDWCPWPRQTPHLWPRNSPLTATT
jgi:hypothetical protein